MVLQLSVVEYLTHFFVGYGHGLQSQEGLGVDVSVTLLMLDNVGR